MDDFRLGLNHLGSTYIRFRANVMGRFCLGTGPIYVG